LQIDENKATNLSELVVFSAGNREFKWSFYFSMLRVESLVRVVGYFGFEPEVAPVAY